MLGSILAPHPLRPGWSLRSHHVQRNPDDEANKSANALNVVEEVLSVSTEDLVKATRVLEAANLRQKKEELRKDETILGHQLQMAIVAALVERGDLKVERAIICCPAISESLGPIQPLALPASAASTLRRCPSTAWTRAVQAEG